MEISVSNELAEKWLRGLGFEPEPEPEWIKSGRKPDFFARGPADCWLEVKELGLPDYEYAFAYAWNDLHERCQKSRLTGTLYAFIGEHDQRAAKAAFRYVKRIHREVTEDGPNIIVMIPGDPDYNANVRVEYESRDGKHTVQVGPGSVSGQYQCFPSLEPANWSAVATLRASTGAETTARLHKILLSRISPPLVLRAFHSTEPLSLSAGHSEARDNTSQSRIRRALADCNSQIRNGQRFNAAPGIAVIYQDFPDALGPEQLLAALFGDLTIEVLRDPARLGRAALAGNGALTRTDNRGISAVRYIRRNANADFVVNPHAEHALPWEHFADAAWVHDTDRYVLSQRASR
jgi:hypothetical protein